MHIARVLSAFALFGLLALGACGRDTGYLYEEKTVSHDEPMGQAKLRDPYRQFIWQFNCPTSSTPLPTPQAGPGELVFAGTGPHEIDRNRLQNTAMKVQGQICPPVDSQRDVVMVFDVSGSNESDIFTRGSDPADRTNKTCGRLQAFEAVLATINWKSTRVGALTFDGNVVASSKGLIDSRDALVNALTDNGSKDLFSVLCHAGGGTLYENPLKEAGGMLARGRENTSKELFFVSDGEPTDKSRAEDVARDLRSPGVRINTRDYPVTIATVLLGKKAAADRYLRDNYASLDMNSIPIHANAAEASRLADILSKMNSENILAGSILKHGAKDSTITKTIDIMPYVQNYLFELPAFYLDPQQISDHYELTFEYWDSHMNKFSVTGSLVLKK